VHYISESWAIDSPSQISKWKDRKTNRSLDSLFRAVDHGRRVWPVRDYRHPDLCKNSVFIPEEDCGPLFMRFLEAVKRNDLAMEINTGGLRKDCREIYPSPRIVQLAAQIGVPITFGSDAHAATEVGMNFLEALQLARTAGYTHSRHFAGRQGRTVAF